MCEAPLLGLYIEDLLSVDEAERSVMSTKY